MRSNHLIATAAVAAVLMATGGAVNAKGCLKGAAVGGVAGHVAGDHGVAGAVGGCIVGRHMANKKAKETQKQQGTSNTPAPAAGAGNAKSSS